MVWTGFREAPGRSPGIPRHPPGRISGCRERGERERERERERGRERERERERERVTDIAGRSSLLDIIERTRNRKRRT